MSPCEITAAIVEFFCPSRFQRAQSWSGQNVVEDYVSRALAEGMISRLQRMSDLNLVKEINAEFCIKHSISQELEVETEL